MPIQVVPIQEPTPARLAAELRPPDGPPERLCLDFLDGLRGLAALYVVLYHFSLVCLALTDAGDWTGRWAGAIRQAIVWSHFLLFQQGQYAVDVFIVLSGYCLMLPVVKTEGLTLKGGAAGYLRRRALRILPPYYAALAVSLLLMGLVPGMSGVRLSYLHWADPALTPAAIISHLLLIHNLVPGCLLRINPPMWSVAVEWQIYFLLPALLLPLWRRFGPGVTVGTALTLGVGLGCALPVLRGSCPWFLGLFAMGAWAADVSFGRRPTPSGLQRFPWGIGAAGFFLLIAALHLVQRKSWESARPLHWLRFETWGVSWPMDVLAGVASCCLLVSCTEMVREGRPPSPILRLLASAPTVRLGAFSYSIYLTHSVLLTLIVLIASRLHPPGEVTSEALVIAGLPLALGLAFLFHLAFERRFIPGCQGTAAGGGHN